jgi:hypothetical protein
VDGVYLSSLDWEVLNNLAWLCAAFLDYSLIQGSKNSCQETDCKVYIRETPRRYFVVFSHKMFENIISLLDVQIY